MVSCKYEYYTASLSLTATARTRTPLTPLHTNNCSVVFYSKEIEFKKHLISVLRALPKAALVIFIMIIDIFI